MGPSSSRLPRTGDMILSHADDQKGGCDMILHLDLSSGASGDKLLAALLTIAEEQGKASLESLQETFARFLPTTAISRTWVNRGGMSAPHIDVVDSQPQPHRHWTDIAELIGNAPIPEGARTRAFEAFERIAQAESVAHGVPVGDVHFHEVGATDSIVDILGVSLLLDALSPSSVHATPLALGHGTVMTAHGLLPVPAPATSSLIRGLPVYAGPVASELTTPTGAALVACNVTSFEPLPPITPHSIGLGAGTRDFEELPNVLRIIAGERPSGPLSLEQVTLLETNIDHISAEQAAFAASELMDAGALDVWQQPIMMKKGRLALKLSILCRPLDADRLAELCHRHTGTLGIRRSTLLRSTLEREVMLLETRFGPVRYKVAQVDEAGKRSPACWIRPEADDVARIARERGLAYGTLFDELVEQGRDMVL